MDNAEPVICKICREPIQNFICVDCVASDIHEWLPHRTSRKFSGFHREFLHHFQSWTDLELCVGCKGINSTTICLYCYTREFFHWLRKRNPPLARKSIQVFFPLYEIAGNQRINEHRHEHLELNDTGYSEELCDSCGEWAILKEHNSEWRCEHCRR